MVVRIESSSNNCLECGGIIAPIEERGDAVCMTCGLVMDERLVDRSNNGIRAFSQEDRDKREFTGSPITTLTPDISLTTMINRKEIRNPNLRRAAKWDSHMKWETKNMLTALTELKRMATHLGLPKRVVESSIMLYKIVFQKGLIKGRSILGMIAACTYYASKNAGIPITLQEYFEKSAINIMILKKCYKILIRELNLKTSVMDPASLIPKYCSELNFSSEIELRASKLLKSYIEKKSSCGKDPKGFCAGAIYLVAKLKNKRVSQKQISEITGVSEVTLRSRYKEMLESVNFIM